MSNDGKERMSIAEAQKRLHGLAVTANQLWDGICELAECLDEPLTEEQDLGLAPEPLRPHLASLLRMSAELTLDCAGEQLAAAAKLRQLDLDARWREDLPLTLAEEARRRLRAFEEVTEGVVDAEPEKTDEALEAFCRLVERGSGLRDLGEHVRRYLAGRPGLPSTPANG